MYTQIFWRRFAFVYCPFHIRKMRSLSSDIRWCLFYPVASFEHVQNFSIKVITRLPNSRMLNIWLNIKNNCSMKKIKIRGMSCNSLWIPAFVVLMRAQTVFSLGHIYFSRDKHVPVEFWYTYFTRNVNLTKRESFLTSNLYHKRRNA